MKKQRHEKRNDSDIREACIERLEKYRNVSIGMRQLFWEFSVEAPRSNPTLVAVG
jgi:hypothetical protein